MNNLNDIKQQIITSCEIADLIAENVKLRPASHGYVGLCPFHQEDTPSFHVYTDTQSYYCFGCHRGGNVFTYVMERDGVNFSEALRILADRAGIKLNADRNIHTEREILSLTEDYYAECLKQSELGRKYLERRSMDKSDIQKYKLGYAPEQWDALTRHLRSKGLSDRQIVNAGLALPSRAGIYDRFRGRIIFPVHDITGKVIAFGGRLISGEGAKYINSPESEIYHKRKNLYLLDIAKKFIREKKRSILCEGYMDALRLHKAGFTESVASLGTSLTPEQAGLLSRYADRCYICYDSDSAGQNAALRGMYILQSNGLDVYVMRLPEGKDPDEYLLTHSSDEFEQLIMNALPLVPAHIAMLKGRLDDKLTRKSAVRELLNALKGLRAGEVLEYKSQVCEAVGLLPSELEGILVSKKTEVYHEEQEHKVPDDTAECGICALLRSDERLRLSINSDELLSVILHSEVRNLACSILNEDVSTLSDLWLSTGDMAKFGMLERGEIFLRELSGLTDEEKFKVIYTALKRKSIECRISEINAKPSSERNYEELMQLYREREKYSR